MAARRAPTSEPFGDSLQGRGPDLNELLLPVALLALIDGGAWPRSEREANQQNRTYGPIPEEAVCKLVPGEERIYLFWPPFSTIAERMARGESEYWLDFGDLDQIDPKRALLIGDFGLGSDAAIILDYQRPGPPRVLRQVWGAKGCMRPRWELFFPNFTDFAKAFALESRRWR